MKKKNIHCGACKQHFNTAAELVEHLKICPLAGAGKKFLKTVFEEGLEPDTDALLKQKPEKTNSTQRSRKHRENNPASGAMDKGRQRQLERVYRFHIARNLNPVTKYPIPDFVDQNSDMFARVKEAYLKECAVPVEVCCG